MEDIRSDSFFCFLDDLAVLVRRKELRRYRRVHDVVERAAQRRIVKAVILYLVFAREPVVCDPANHE